MSVKGIIYYESSFEKANEELKKMVDRYITKSEFQLLNVIIRKLVLMLNLKMVILGKL